MNSTLAGRYRETFLHYLIVANEYCEAMERSKSCKKLFELKKTFKDDSAAILEHSEEMLPAYRVLVEHYALVNDINESLSRLQTDLDIKTKAEKASFLALKTAILEVFGDNCNDSALCAFWVTDEDKDIYDNFRHFLVESYDARARRDCYRRLLVSQKDLMSPSEMETEFIGEAFTASFLVTKIKL